jgi:hypothetical protein
VQRNVCGFDAVFFDAACTEAIAAGHVALPTVRFGKACRWSCSSFASTVAFTLTVRPGAVVVFVGVFVVETAGRSAGATATADATDATEPNPTTPTTPTTPPTSNANAGASARRAPRLRAARGEDVTDCMQGKIP